MKGYGQFCPVARAAEILTERWTLLVIRELLCESTRFSDLRRGVPLMSPSLLSQRLKMLEDGGVVVRRRAAAKSGWEYRLTPAGEELRPLVELLGVWGRRWVDHELTGEELDPILLMWDMRRRIDLERMPEQRVVVRFDFASAPATRRRWWLVWDRETIDVCLRNPGHPVDLIVATDVRTMSAVWMGQETLQAAQRSGRLSLTGQKELTRQFGSWLKLSIFAHVDPDAALPEVLSSATAPARGPHGARRRATSSNVAMQMRTNGPKGDI
jgi:DNA-binding HxlR family transcriptional regulator